MDQWSILLSGSEGIGKKALAVQFTMQNFDETYYDPTLEEGYRKQWVVDNQTCLVYATTTVGEIENAVYNHWQSIYRADGIFLVYSISYRPSFDQLRAFWQEIRRIRGDNIPLILLANKCDLLDHEISTTEGAALASQFGCPFLEVSAKTGLNVDRAFADFIRLLRQQKADATKGSDVTVRAAKGRTRSCVVL
ncbi:P-loop containing nucleoside triphosphate hydrolase protein [Mycena belliarum]|uniref:P-loop containing nucleoside triphosphate hydrolase protein n=1 Tax=Mycena belliarum TaxID=1033014 RepID=A0AAD6U7Z3_9AGAR|nr:P-loop containing nucleoside triphosphate hydrolase protein [Mycena belliae]